MKITINNLGTIKKTELDLRPLTIIIGPNNTSKTYLTYTIYGLWKACAGPRSLDPPDLIPTTIESDQVAFSRQQLIEPVRMSINTTAAQFTSELTGYFQDSSQRLFAATSIETAIEPSEILDAVEAATKDLSEWWTSATLHDDNLRLTPIPEPNAKSIAPFIFVLSVIRHIFPQPTLLPAERNAFIITYKMLATRRYRLLRGHQREIFAGGRVDERQLQLLREQGDIRYPAPIEDFLDFLTDVELSKSDLASIEKNEFHQLANNVEEFLQDRQRTKFSATQLGGRELRLNVKRGFNIDLYNASSSIKQLAPLLLFLRFRAKKGGFLVIDEPEMNLHPEAQVRLLEVLAILVNLGVRVLLTTHSPYFMAYLNNLVAAAGQSAAQKEKSAAQLHLGDPRAFLSMEQVSAYEMKGGGLRTLKDPDFGIRWDTLSDVFGDIQQRYFAIHEGGKRAHGKKKKA